MYMYIDVYLLAMAYVTHLPRDCLSWYCNWLAPSQNWYWKQCSLSLYTLHVSLSPPQSWTTVCQSHRSVASLTRCCRRSNASTLMGASTATSRQAISSSAKTAPSGWVGLYSAPLLNAHEYLWCEVFFALNEVFCELLYLWSCQWK